MVPNGSKGVEDGRSEVHKVVSRVPLENCWGPMDGVMKLSVIAKKGHFPKQSQPQTNEATLWLLVCS
jgi:hypothetical protein